MQSAAAGYHTLKWNATNDYGDPVGAGVYLYQFRAKTLSRLVRWYYLSSLFSNYYLKRASPKRGAFLFILFQPKISTQNTF